jgi:hypothetical protein
MSKLILDDDDEDGSQKLSRQALSFFTHMMIALGAWMAMMLVGYIINPESVSQWVVLMLSILVPLAAGYGMARVKPDEMAPHIWLAGLIWMLLISLWILDMPTGPNACFECGATEKLTRALFSVPRPSGLIDNNGPFFGTWPAAALLGYAIGARIAIHRPKPRRLKVLE